MQYFCSEIDFYNRQNSSNFAYSKSQYVLKFYTFSGDFRSKNTTAALTSGGGGYKNIMKITSPFGGFGKNQTV